MVAFVALLYVARLLTAAANQPDDASAAIFFRMIATGEPYGILAMLLFALGTFWVRSTGGTAVDSVLDGFGALSERRRLWFAVACTVILVGIATASLEAGAFSMDEFGAVFQAKLFASGRVAAPVPEEWKPHLTFITPVFVAVRPSDSAWVSTYLPGNAAIRAPFELVRVGWLTGLCLAVLAVYALTLIARARWQDAQQRWVAVGVLVLSTQFALVAATPYAMTAHLALNLAWLYCWMRPGRSWLVSGPLGFMGMLLHQPIPHLLFAAPFGVRALRERRWSRVLWMGGWYVGGIVATVGWHDLVGYRQATGGLAAALALPSVLTVFVMVLHFVLLMSWQTPIAGLAIFSSFRRRRTLDPIDVDLLSGIVLSLGFYLFFRLVTQGHGWGWRYGHQVLGNVALLAGSAWPFIRRDLNRTQQHRLLALTVAITLLVQFPARLLVARRYAVPFARADRWLHALDADVVLVPTDSVWYGRDLIRNDPGLPRPVLVHDVYARRPDVQAVLQRPGRRITRVSVSQLTQFGLERIERPPVW